MEYFWLQQSLSDSLSTMCSSVLKRKVICLNNIKKKNREKIPYKAVMVNKAQYKRRNFHVPNLIFQLSS